MTRSSHGYNSKAQSINDVIFPKFLEVNEQSDLNEGDTEKNNYQLMSFNHTPNPSGNWQDDFTEEYSITDLVNLKNVLNQEGNAESNLYRTGDSSGTTFSD